MNSKIICKCNNFASECTFLRTNLVKSNVVGLIIYSDSNSIDDYVEYYNKNIYNWIQTNFYQHLRLCKGSDRAVALLSLSFKDIFAKLKLSDINNPELYNKNADEIKSRLVKIAREKVPYIFKLAKDIRNLYGNINESKLYTEISWTLVGRKIINKRYNSGILPYLYELLQNNLNRKILIQIDIPDGSINYNGRNEYRYWDIYFHISSCGKVEKNETYLDAILRETIEEIDLNIKSKDIIYNSFLDGIQLFCCNLNEFNINNMFINDEYNWNGCYKCVYRYFKHKYRVKKYETNNIKYKQPIYLN
jgi:hypothetical protein